MAEAIENSNECPICQEEAVILKCLGCEHFMCEKCLERISSFENNKRIVKCPFDRKTTELSDGKVGSLKSKLLNGQLVCDGCCAEKSISILWWCIACQLTLCSDCAMKKHRDHACNPWENYDVVKDCANFYRKKHPRSRDECYKLKDEIGQFCSNLYAVLADTVNEEELAWKAISNLESVFGSSCLTEDECISTDNKIQKKLLIVSKLIASSTDNDPVLPASFNEGLCHPLKLPLMEQVLSLCFENKKQPEKMSDAMSVVSKLTIHPKVLPAETPVVTASASSKSLHQPFPDTAAQKLLQKKLPEKMPDTMSLVSKQPTMLPAEMPVVSASASASPRTAYQPLSDAAARKLITLVAGPKTLSEKVSDTMSLLPKLTTQPQISSAEATVVSNSASSKTVLQPLPGTAARKSIPLFYAHNLPTVCMNPVAVCLVSLIELVLLNNKGIHIFDVVLNKVIRSKGWSNQMPKGVISYPCQIVFREKDDVLFICRAGVLHTFTRTLLKQTSTINLPGSYVKNDVQPRLLCLFRENLLVVFSNGLESIICRLVEKSWARVWWAERKLEPFWYCQNVVQPNVNFILISGSTVLYMFYFNDQTSCFQSAMIIDQISGPLISINQNVLVFSCQNNLLFPVVKKEKYTVDLPVSMMPNNLSLSNILSSFGDCICVVSPNGSQLFIFKVLFGDNS